MNQTGYINIKHQTEYSTTICDAISKRRSTHAQLKTHMHVMTII